MADRLRDLPQQVEADVDVEALGPFRQPVVEALRAVAVREDERRAERVVGVRLRREDPVVPHVLQDPVLALRRPPQRRARFLRDAAGRAVDPDPRPLRLDRHVAGRPVLIARPLQQQLVEPVVAHPPRALRGADARLLQRPVQRPRQRPVQPPARRRSRAEAHERGGDPRPLAAPRPRVAQVHPVAQRRREPALHRFVRQKDVRLQKRTPHRLQGRLPPQQRGQLLRLPVRQQQRVVERARPSLAPPRPGPLIAGHHAGRALDLDQEEPLRRQRQQVDLVDRPVVGEELEVRPDPVGLDVGQAAAHEGQRVPLPRVLGDGHLAPAGGGGIHRGARRDARPAASRRATACRTTAPTAARRRGRTSSSTRPDGGSDDTIGRPACVWSAIPWRP